MILPTLILSSKGHDLWLPVYFQGLLKCLKHKEHLLKLSGGMNENNN